MRILRAAILLVFVFAVTPTTTADTCYADPYGELTCTPDICSYELVEGMFASAQSTYDDWSETYWSARIYENTCTGSLRYVWTPVFRYCPDENNCIAKNLYPNVPALP